MSTFQHNAGFAIAPKGLKQGDVYKPLKDNTVITQSQIKIFVRSYLMQATITIMSNTQTDESTNGFICFYALCDHKASV